MLRPEVASVSQTERLRAAMAAGAITHGQAVRADIEQVEVSTKAGAMPLVYFCALRGLRVSETIRPGDGGPLPADVAVAGLAVEREGMYDVRNALISSNGRIEITLDERSSVVPAHRSVFGLPVDAWGWPTGGRPNA
jgi:hypothetical protein